jgi:hypothetical protein
VTAAVAPKLNPETAAARLILADGEWHSLDELLAKVGHLITPGRAMRRRERDRVLLLRRTPGPPMRPPRLDRSPEYLLAVGRRAILRDAIKQTTESRVVERALRGARAPSRRRRVDDSPARSSG